MMATDGPTTDGPAPAPCDGEVLRNGTLVMVTHTITPNAMEGWVRMAAYVSGQRVDWHYAGGRACVLALGDLPAVRATLRELMPAHDALQRTAALETLPDHPFAPDCTLYAEGESNTAYELVRSLNAERAMNAERETGRETP